MTRLLILDKREGIESPVLISLRSVLQRLPLDRVDVWLVKNIEAQGVMPFGVSLTAFEDLAERLKHGVAVTAEELHVFTAEDIEVLEGEFVGLAFRRPPPTGVSGIEDFRLLSLKCVDSTLWECETDDSEIRAAIKHNFSDVEER
jgi:hypothetical protein